MHAAPSLAFEDDPVALLAGVMTSESPRARLRFRRATDEEFDAYIFTTGADKLTAALRADSSLSTAVATIVSDSNRVCVKFSDPALASADRRLECHGSRALSCPTPPAPRAIVAFCHPNATKALHVGHMRNLALGGAFTRLLELAGAQVIAQTAICDCGRAAAEAVAGYLGYYRATDPVTLAVRPDVFVGDCYSTFHRRFPSCVNAEPDPDVRAAASASAMRDPAEEVLRALRAQDPATVSTWERLRDWVLEGHAHTFQRLGVAFTRAIFESGALPEVATVVEHAVRLGIFERNADGSVDMPAQDGTPVRVPMIRPDGIETEHMRQFIIWRNLQTEHQHAPRTHCINITGSEWRATGLIREAALAKLLPCPLYASYRRISVGMVRTSQGVVKSSAGRGMLIEDCLDSLSVAVQDRDLLRPGLSVDESAGAVLKAGLLSEKPSEPFLFSLERVLDPEANPAWTILRAWKHASAAATDPSALDPRPHDGAYRTALMRTYNLSGLWHNALNRHEPREVLQYLFHSAAWYLERHRHPSVSRIMCQLFGIAASSINLVSPTSIPQTTHTAHA